MKRWYTEVAVAAAAEGRMICLDGKPAGTPARAPLVLPNARLAEAVAAEWVAQGERLAPATMPLTGLANAAIDRVAPDVPGFAARLAAFARHELLAYRATHPAPLIERQAATWDPLLAWAAARYDAAFTVTAGVLPVAQPPATLERLGTAFAHLDPFRLAALDPVVTIGGSAVLGLALLAGRIDTDALWAAGQLDELWQAEQWGRDPLAEAGHAERRAALAAAAAFLELLGPCDGQNG